MGDPLAARREAIAAFYEAWAYRHRRAVIRRTRGARDDAIADACAFAWLQLAAREDVTLDERGFGWLTVVAVRDVWHQLDRNRQERPAGALTLPTQDDEELPEPAA